MNKKHLITIGLLLFWHIIVKASDTIPLEVINTSHADYAKYSKYNIRFSALPAYPYEDSITRFADLLGHEYEFFDYLFPITYSREFAKNESNWGWIRFFINKRGKLKIAVDANMDGKLELREIKDLKYNRDTIRIQIGQNNIDYELFIPDKSAVRTSIQGSVHVKPITYFRGKFYSNGDSTELIVTDDILGIRIYMDNMSIDAKALNNVKLNQTFYYKSNAGYLFFDCDIYNTALYVMPAGAVDKPEGVDVGYYVNMAKLFKHLKTNPENKKIVFYFWGSWCRPCVDKLPQTFELYNFVQGKKNVEMFFCSINTDNNDVIKSNLLLGGNIDENRRVNEFFRDVTMLTHDDYTVQYGTLISTLKVSSYPTYVLVSEDGKILYRGSTVLPHLYALIENQ